MLRHSVNEKKMKLKPHKFVTEIVKLTSQGDFSQTEQNCLLKHEKVKIVPSCSFNHLPYFHSAATATSLSSLPP
jgi:predicted GNAT family acetyltransferase